MSKRAIKALEALDKGYLNASVLAPAEFLALGNIIKEHGVKVNPDNEMYYLVVWSNTETINVMEPSSDPYSAIILTYMQQGISPTESVWTINVGVFDSELGIKSTVITDTDMEAPDGETKAYHWYDTDGYSYFNEVSGVVEILDAGKTTNGVANCTLIADSSFEFTISDDVNALFVNTVYTEGEDEPDDRFKTYVSRLKKFITNMLK